MGEAGLDPTARAAELAGTALRGDRRALARLLTAVENRTPVAEAAMRELYQWAGRAHTVGITGPPGAGKSTLVAALIGELRRTGRPVAVIAVDPSSPITGGALLGDRVRMQDHATDPGVFIRSMATRGHLGGLSEAAPQALRVLDAAGFAVLLVETVGVGQAEVEIASLADTTLVAVAPGMGDAIQAAKAGILEVGDVFVVNKADKPGAQEAVRDLRGMIAMARRSAEEWKPPIVTTVAIKGEGIAELAEKVDAHWSWLDSSGQGEARRRARARAEITAIALAELRRRVGGLPGDAQLEDLAGQVAAGKLDPFTAADELIAADPAASTA